LRLLGSGPLPGQALVILEPDRMLLSDVFPCEDGHAQERSLLPQVTKYFAALTPAELARILKTLAENVCPDRFRMNTRDPKKPPPKRSSAKRHPHVSTARILAKRKQQKVHAKQA
jgi:hypothetical protein